MVQQLVGIIRKLVVAPALRHNGAR